LHDLIDGPHEDFQFNPLPSDPTLAYIKGNCKELATKMGMFMPFAGFRAQRLGQNQRVDAEIYAHEATSGGKTDRTPASGKGRTGTVSIFDRFPDPGDEFSLSPVISPAAHHME